MSKANAAMNPVPGHAEHVPDLKDDLDVKEAQLEAEAEYSDDAVLAAAAYGGPVVDRKELWSYYLYYNGDVSNLITALSTSHQILTPHLCSRLLLSLFMTLLEWCRSTRFLDDAIPELGYRCRCVLFSDLFGC